jgi:hypothetical protein
MWVGVHASAAYYVHNQVSLLRLKGLMMMIRRWGGFDVGQWYVLVNNVVSLKKFKMARNLTEKISNFEELIRLMESARYIFAYFNF